jgi:polyhydroxybutyrate depolymerase
MIHRLLLLLALADASAPQYPSFTLSTFSVDGRDVDAYVPDCAHAKSPIILSLHAWATSRSLMAQVDRLPAYAAEDCAVIVYPQGKVRGKLFGIAGFSWNAGGCCPNANTAKVPDADFLGDVITETAQKFKVNEDLVFVVGLSNGGMMANRLACANQKVKAFVAVSGPLMNGTGSATEFFPCPRSVPTLHFHGTEDGVVPYDGCTKNSPGEAGLACRAMAALGGFPPLPWPTVPSTIASWRARNSIPADAQGSITFKNGTTSCTSWGSNANNVSFCTVGGEGHAWPNPHSSNAACVIPGMHCSRDIDASREAMAFFRRYIPAQAEMLV